MEQKKFLLVALCAISLVFGINAGMMKSKNTCNENTIQLRLDMRKLWEDHIQWTRNYIISAIANLPDQNPVAARLLQNQVDIGNAFKPYFGRNIGNRLSKLLKQHVLIAVNVIADAIANNTSQFEQDYADWQKNARMIARFLSGKNSHWSKKELKKMLYEHLDLTAGEVSSRLQSNWVADINFYDENHVHMLIFADILTEGIIKEFPNKF